LTAAPFATVRAVAGDAIDLVLFDLGGVLIELGGVTSMRELAGIESDDELWARWLACPWVRRYERGECSPDEFATGIVAEWGLSVEPAAFLDAFAAWPVGPYAGAGELVDRTRAATTVGCLSNTNVGHWDRNFSRWPIFEAFDHRFLSFELGLLKPDREVFDHVATLVDLPPGRILFLDDNQQNVDGALAAGFTAVRTRGVAEAEQALIAAGVLEG
jgi:putative hydrolase of the HAD superfamily